MGMKLLTVRTSASSSEIRFWYLLDLVAYFTRGHCRCLRPSLNGYPTTRAPAAHPPLHSSWVSPSSLSITLSHIVNHGHHKLTVRNKTTTITYTYSHLVREIVGPEPQWLVPAPDSGLERASLTPLSNDPLATGCINIRSLPINISPNWPLSHRL
jgi:hypothetical protein